VEEMIVIEEVWNLLAQGFDEKARKNEAIKNGWCLLPPDGGCRVIRIDYARISDKKLIQNHFDIPMRVVREFSPPTIRAMCADILENKFRKDEDGDLR
jgi:hypothetical protein